MATQKGILQFEGTLGGINFYFRKGKAVARKSGGGFNGKAIKTKDSMVRVRENGSEFGAVAKAKKLIRLSVQEALLHFQDGTLHGRMMQVLQEIKVCDLDSERGKRTVWEGLKTSNGAKLFTDFLFTPKQDVYSLLGGIPDISNSSGNCSFAGLQLGSASFKKSATHLKMQFFIVDYEVINLEFKRYSATPLIVAKSALPVSVPDFEVNGLPPISTFRMSFLAVQFYQEINGNLMELKEEGMIGLRVAIS